jgi:tripartite-type tricarboxylate transporter receptor subunit TctC
MKLVKKYVYTVTLDIQSPLGSLNSYEEKIEVVVPANEQGVTDLIARLVGDFCYEKGLVASVKSQMRTQPIYVISEEPKDQEPRSTSHRLGV